MPRSRRPDILRVLKEAEEPLSAAQVAKATGCAYSTTGVHLQRLKEAGQVRAEEIPSSRGGPPTSLYALVRLQPSAFDDEPEFWADVAAAISRAALEREERRGREGT